ncbi:MAG: hypothetical protein BWY49_00062 [Candidatus Omnitrophica bacterium ADurb.Bin314]|nr:MAG: hypothetical protein BWY49_00062 [Candidatus Omnitrophica bacterium ADurb.Bin314]
MFDRDQLKAILFGTIQNLNLDPGTHINLIDEIIPVLSFANRACGDRMDSLDPVGVDHGLEIPEDIDALAHRDAAQSSRFKNILAETNRLLELLQISNLVFASDLGDHHADRDGSDIDHRGDMFCRNFRIGHSAPYLFVFFRIS